MKIVLQIDPKYYAGEFFNNGKDNDEWGRWDMWVRGHRFYGTSTRVWNSFLRIIDGEDVDVVLSSHNR